MLYNTQDKPVFLTGGIAKALARVCRFGWLEIEEVKQVTFATERILSQNFSLVHAGFKFLEELITEIGEPIKGRSLALNRKIAVNFRDEALGSIFSYCLYLLNTKMQELPRNLIGSVLNVAHMCMNFDFLGISSDETSEDSLCLQIPITWKSHFENPVLFGLLEFIITNTAEEVETLGIRVFNHMGAVRKSIFSGSVEFRQNYISKYLKCSESIMLTKKLEGDSLFEFINSVKRFLSNFGLKEVAEVSGFESWVQSLAGFSLHLFRSSQAITSGIESSMFVWSYLAYESHHQLNQRTPQVSQFISGLFKAFLDSTLDQVTASVLSPENEGDLKDHLELISNFSLYYYAEIVKLLEAVYLDLLAAYDLGKSPHSQAKFAWLIALASGFIGLREGKTCDLELRLDAMMIQLVFQTMAKVQTQETEECLEISYLLFFIGLSKVYVNSTYDSLWAILDNSQSSPEDTLNSLVTLVVEKCLKNLSVGTSERVTRLSLELFEQLCKGYYSTKVLVKNEVIQSFMMQYRTYPMCLHNSKLRCRVFNALAHLWMNEDLGQAMDSFLVPMSEQIQSLLDLPNVQHFEFLFRELQGICSALQNQKTYLDFFEWFYDKFAIVMAACQNYLYQDAVMDSMLKFLMELVYCRNSRIKFDNATAYGVVLFKNLSSVVNGYGKVVVENAGSPEFFKKFYGKIRRILGIMTYILGGGYVAFGVFEVYGDMSFVDSLRTCFAVLGTIPRSEITVFFRQSYVKLLDTIYDFLELTCKSHLKTVFTQLPSSCFPQLMLYLVNGVSSSSNLYVGMKHCVCAANSTGYLCEYIIKMSQREGNEKQAVQRVLSECPMNFTELFEIVVEVIVLEDSNFMWSLSKPLLGLIIVNEHSFESVKRYVVTKASTNAEAQQKLYESLSSLMNGVSRTMELKNRDRFAKNFSALRQVLSNLN